MQPYNSDDAEDDLIAAINTGDQNLIEHLGALIDRMQQAADEATLLAAALWYAEVGLRVFPCQPLAKIPYPGSHGLHDASSSIHVIRDWWQQAPNANLAIATGHLIDVVDIDGERGQISRVRNWHVFGQIKILATVSTPSPGGMHLYVKAQPERGNLAGFLPGIDYRGGGGYILAPPSRTNRGDYRFLTPLNPRDLIETSQ